ncbi:MAG TPA: GNAT family N-acetyltransferase [Pseudonocardiaceae bacterium]
MRLRLHLVRMVDQEVWRSAREEIPEHRAVLVELTADGVSGWGESSDFMATTYRSNISTVINRLRAVEPLLKDADPTQPEQLWHTLYPVLADCPFALGALDVAAHDLAARLAGEPLYRHLGLPDPSGVPSSYSIGLDSPDKMVAKLTRTPGWSLYKVKLARAEDLDVVRALREHTDAPFWLDGNACWTPEGLFKVLDQLADLNIAALEQPFPVGEVEAHREVRRRSPVPIFADESVTTPDQVPAAVDQFDGVNLKVLKAGGLTPILHMVHDCRNKGLATMLGCLPESSAGASAAAHLAGATDHVDLDTVALLATDTGDGVRLTAEGRIVLPDRPGTGFEPDPTRPAWVLRRLGPEDLRSLGETWPTAHRVPTADADRALHVAALREGRVIGLATAVPEPAPFRTATGAVPAWRLCGVLVDPARRGVGVGTALVDRVVQELAEPVWCPAAAGPRPFLDRAGFRQVTGSGTASDGHLVREGGTAG